MLQTVEINPTGNPSHSIIWLHGLGADGYDFVPIAQELGLNETRFIFPHAPYRPISAFSGYETRGWYDILGLEVGSPQDASGIIAMQNEINALISQEHQRGIPYEKIVLAGFSQGGAMALHTALRHPQKLAGIIGLSTYLPLRDSLPNEITRANAKIPVFLAHGNNDDVIKLNTAKLALDALLQEDIPVSWHQYEMAHSVCHQEIMDIRAFLLALDVR